MASIAPKISVIVPAYNCENTLELSVNSITAQTLSDFEIILVDDGSTDRTLAIAERLKATDSRIKPFSKPNGGQSSARNFGLDHAAGDYIAFVDADDTVEPTFLKTLYDNAVETNSDLSVCAVQLVNGTAISPASHESRQRVVFSRHEAVEQLLIEQYIHFSVCDKLYRRCLFQQLRFEEGVIHEDVVLPYRILQLCDNIVCEMLPLYNYHIGAPSTTRQEFSPKHLNDITAREEIAADVANEYPELVQHSQYIRLVGYLNIANRLVDASDSAKAEFFPEIIRQVRKNRRQFLYNKYIGLKKKLGVVLLLIGKAPYSWGYRLLMRK